jgi:hypothetical protein
LLHLGSTPSGDCACKAFNAVTNAAVPDLVNAENGCRGSGDDVDEAPLSPTFFSPVEVGFGVGSVVLLPLITLVILATPPGWFMLAHVLASTVTRSPTRKAIDSFPSSSR